MFERFVALLLIVVLSPVLAFLAFVTYLVTLKKPIYLHRRLGQYGKDLYVYKFLTMNPAIRLTVGEYKELNATGKIKNDYRVYRPWGSFLRKTHLDELPQLFNILEGEMSFVGPRPRTPEEFFPNDADTKYILSVKPGVTGYRQIRENGHALTIREKNELDLRGIAEKSFSFSAIIIVVTIFTIFMGTST